LLGLSFGNPYLLIFLLLVPAALLAYRYLDHRREHKADEWTSPQLLPNMMPANPGRRRYVPLVLFMLGLTFLLVGFARPQAKLNTVRQDATVVLALDESGSMAATDVHPTRLLAADAAIIDFLHGLPVQYRASLITFSDEPAVTVPPTVNRAQLIQALPKQAEPRGTALGDAIAAATLVATKSIGPVKPGAQRPPAEIILLSDGTQNAGRLPYQTAAQQAAKAGIPVSTVLIGTSSGAVCQKLGTGACQQKQVPTTPVALQAIAKTTGGEFFAGTSANAVDQVYKQLGSHLAHTKKSREITPAVVGVALLLILAGAIASAVWFRRVV